MTGSKSLVILDADGQPMASTATPTRAVENTASRRAVASWRPPLKSADGTLMPKRNMTVARARDLEEGNGLVSGGVNRYVTGVLGMGLRPDYQPRARALGMEEDALDEFTEQVESEFELWAKDIDGGADHQGLTTLGGLAYVAYMHSFLDGDGFTIPRWSKDRHRKYQTCLQNIDPDRVSDPNGRRIWTNGNEIRMGVERVASGRHVALHIRNQHPGDYGLGKHGPVSWVRVPKFIPGTRGRRGYIHYFKATRADQSRGKSRLNAIIEKHKMADILQDTSLQAYILNAMMSYFITSPFDDELLGDKLGALVEGSDGDLAAYQAFRTQYHKDYNMQLGGVHPLVLAPGERPETLDSNRPGPGYEPFMSSFNEEFASAIGFSLDQYTQNYSRTNYSGARQGDNNTGKLQKHDRGSFGHHWYSHVFALFFEEAWSKGYIKPPKGAPDFYENRAAWLNCEWIGPARGWVDPVKEIDAVGKRVQMKVSNLKGECAEQGTDWRSNARQTKKEVDYYNSIGLLHPAQMEASSQTMAVYPSDEEDQPKKGSEE